MDNTTPQTNSGLPGNLTQLLLLRSLFAQPMAELQQTRAGAAAAGQSAATSATEQQNLLLQQKQEQQAVQRQNFKIQTQQQFDANKNAEGFIPPSIYNNAKAQASAIGIGDGEFDGLFKQPYTDPSNIAYNTPEGRINQQAYGEVQRKINTLLDSYSAIPADQKGLFSKSLTEGVPFLGQILAPQAYSYDKTAQGLATELKSIVGGGPGSGLRITQAELTNWANLLPTPRNSDAVNQANIQKLDKQIKATFNTPTGVNPKYLPQTQNQNAQTTTGASSAFQNPLAVGLGLPGINTPQAAIRDVANIARNTATTGGNALQTVLSGVQKAEPPQAIAGDVVQQQGIPLFKGLVDTLQNIGGIQTANKQPILPPNQSVFQPGGLNAPTGINPVAGLNFVAEHPVTTALTALPFLSKGFGEGAAPETTGGATTTQEVGIPQAPQTTLNTNPILDFLNPKGRIAAQGNFRTALIDKATSAGKTLPASDLTSDIANWATTAKRGNLGQGDYIDQVVKDAKTAFQGDLTPQELADAYAEADSGYTRNGIPKTPIQANVDRGLRDIIGKRLDQLAPGWKNATSEMAQGYASAKSPLRSIGKRAAGIGLGYAGFDTIRHILGLP